jgi:hypothetical protein
MATGHGRFRRFIAVCAAAVVGAALVAPGSASAAGSAGDTLTAAVSSLRGLGYNLTGSSGTTASGGTGMLSATGSVDPNAHAATVDFHGTEAGNPVNVDFTQIGDKFYAKLDLGSLQSQLGVPADQWMSIDESKLTGAQAVPFDMSGSTDALDVAGLLTSVSDVTYPNPSDPTRISGTVDLTAATGVGAPDPSDLKDAGAAAKSTPFTATIDDQGRLTDLKIDADAYDGNLSDEIMYSDFGSPDAVSAPAASVPAPASAYAFFNN